MNVNDHLKNLLENSSKYALTELDKEMIQKHGISEYIFRKLMSKKFRKWSLPESVQKQVKSAINTSVEENQPIHLNLSYGGFKLWRLPTTPEVDWSEFFYLAHHIRYMSSIAAAYGPGITLELSSGDIAVTSMNNVPREDVDQYDTSMRALVGMFRSYLPQNIKIEVTRLRDFFKDDEEFIQEGEKLREGARERFAQDSHYADEFHRGSIQNVQLVGGVEDLSQATKEELKEIRERSAEIIEAMYFIPQVGKSGKPNQLYLLATNMSLDIPMIATGATKYSTAKFWAGVGVVAKNDEKFAEYVVTPNQWNYLKGQDHEVIKTNLIALNNFKEIIIYPKKLKFKK